MSAALAIQALAEEFARQGIKPGTVELVMPEAAVEIVRRELRRPSRSPTRGSFQLIAGILVTGEATVRDRTGMMGDLIDGR